VLAAAELLPKCTGYRDLITIDMGGTSYDVCLIADAVPKVTSETYVERHAVALPMFGIHTIGAGGGSVARLDAANGLHVGPASAGAVPGPACYGRGGSQATVTDANLVLGYLDPGATFGGSVKLDIEAARAVVRRRIAEPLGIGLEEAAYGILRIVNAQMTNGIRVVSVQQGHDPRDFVLVAFGGNGAVHAGRQAEDLDIGTVLAPRMAGAFSAFGGLFAAPQIDHLATWVGRCDDADGGELGDAFAALRDKGRAVLGTEVELQHECWLACHYAGQTSEIWVPIEVGHGAVDGESLQAAAQCFHVTHERERSFAKRQEPVHVIGIKVTSRRPRHRPPPTAASAAGASGGTAVAASRRDVYFSSEDGWVATPVYDGSQLGAGALLEGPAIVQEPDATIVVYPHWSCRLDQHDIYHLTYRRGRP